MTRRRIARDALYVLSWLFLLALLLQFFLAGAGAFGATSFDAHAGLGALLALGALIILVVALLAGDLRRAAALLLAFMVVQMFLGGLGRDEEPWIGAFHALNAVAVLAVAYYLARAARSLRASAP
jgi:hypothetical protein